MCLIENNSDEPHTKEYSRTIKLRSQLQHLETDQTKKLRNEIDKQAALSIAKMIQKVS